MNSTNQEKLNADTLFAFQMALKGHKQFECYYGETWYRSRSETVNSLQPHRIYHDIPEGWTRHDGEDWKGDKDAKFEYIMFCDGVRMTSPEKAFWFSAENRFACSPEHRIYAYKLAAKSPAIPEGFILWNGGECPVAPETKVEYIQRNRERYKASAGHCRWAHIQAANDIIAYRVIEKKVIPWDFETAPLRPVRVKRKRDGALFALGFYPDGVAIFNTSSFGGLPISYEALAADYLQLDSSPCRKEVEQ